MYGGVDIVVPVVFLVSLGICLLYPVVVVLTLFFFPFNKSSCCLSKKKKKDPDRSLIE